MTAIKYSTTPVNYTIKSNNIVIGNDIAPYGPTSSTGFYAGITPPDNGYTIYCVNSATHIPTAVVAHNDDECIWFAKSFDGTNIVTIQDAIAYLITGSTGTTIVNMDCPRIATSGLTMYMATEYLPSYPRKGSTWRDLSGNQNHGAIGSTVVFDNINYGEFIFSARTGNMDHKSDNIYIPHSAFGEDAQWTLSAWFKTTATYYQEVADGYSGEMWGGLVVLSYDPILAVFDTGAVAVSWSDGVTYPRITTTGTTYNDGIYHNATATYDGTYVRLYMDGNLFGSPYPTSTIHSIYDDFYIGVEISLGDRTFNGSIASAQIYDRAISSAEVLQNYDAMKSIRNIIFFDDFSSYTPGYLGGQGRWETYLANPSGHLVTTDKTVTGDGSSNYDLVDFNSDLDESLGWKLSFRITKFSNEGSSIFIGNSSYLKIWNDNGAEFIWCAPIITDNVTFWRDPNYQVGDIIKIKRQGKHLEFYLNGEIDTEWYLHEGDATGDDGVFDCANDFDWDESDAIWLLLSDLDEIDDIRFEYNIM